MYMYACTAAVAPPYGDDDDYDDDGGDDAWLGVCCKTNGRCNRDWSRPAIGCRIDENSNGTSAELVERD